MKINTNSNSIIIWTALSWYLIIPYFLGNTSTGHAMILDYVLDVFDAPFLPNGLFFFHASNCFFINSIVSVIDVNKENK